jgi:putative PIN family toxin of toxin-antitoxin system
MRVVLDANVLLAGFATHGLCEALVVVVLESHHLILSEHLLGEVRRHLTGKFRVPEARSAAIDAFLRSQAELVEPAAVPRKACRDPDDLPVLGTALAGQAGLLVTGDQDLLTLDAYAGVPIVRPRTAYERLR